MTQEYINKNKNKFLNELFEFIKIPGEFSKVKEVFLNYMMKMKIF